jgi:LysR family glycine cleavage system transcriptional activator
MSLTRRFLPSMSLLCAFEAAARLSSFTGAASEMNLTQSAVSRQIRALEELLGADLFIRERQTVRLTVAGESYAREVRESLRRISTATLGFRANPSGGTLNLAILPTFGMRWLAPRLTSFTAANPGVTINLVTRLSAFDFRFDAVDAAIHYGLPEWPGAHLDFLFSEIVVPACSPRLKDNFRFAKPADLLDAPLLHLVSRPDAWERWFHACNMPNVTVKGMLLDQFAIATQAAIADLGVALLPRFLFEPEFERGDLVEAVDAPQCTKEAYYLAGAEERTDYPPLMAFRTWLTAEAKAFRNGSEDVR